MKKTTLKDILGELPYSAELFWYIRQTGKPPVGGFSLKPLADALPGWARCVEQADVEKKRPRKVVIFTMLRYWIEHTTLLALGLTALGHDVTLVYLPYAHWKRKVNKFDLRRQDLYIQDVLQPLKSLMGVVSLLEWQREDVVPGEVSEKLQDAIYRDVQYSLLREDVDPDSELYRLRKERNEFFSRRFLAYLRQHAPDVLITPNGSMLEFGMAYQTARYLGLPVVTYEFGEQNERVWMAQNDDVMRQNTDAMWNAVQHLPLSDEQWQRVKTFFAARQGGGLWENFSRRWQGTPNLGAEAVKQSLSLDDRLIVLLPTNVLGDSLTLGRHLFSDSMTQWIARTIEYFSRRDDAQLVIRVHPGEQMGWGPSVYDILLEKFPQLPENIRLLPANAKVNTYDLVNAADLGLVFTTTVGLEMAMSGLPVIVSGQTHYRGKGFTIDPATWDEYFDALDAVLSHPEDFRPAKKQVERAWTYAYRFFFEYPQPFPWHVQHVWQDVEKWPLERVLSAEGLAKFGQTFDYFTGEPIVWVKDYDG